MILRVVKFVYGVCSSKFELTSCFFMKQMASTFGTKKRKGPKLPEKTYLPDSDSDSDAFDFSFLDFYEETFKSASNLCDAHFLNLLCDENLLRRSIDGKVDDGDIPGVQQNEHAHLDEDDEDIGVEYRMHDVTTRLRYDDSLVFILKFCKRDSVSS